MDDFALRLGRMLADGITPDTLTRERGVDREITEWIERFELRGEEWRIMSIARRGSMPYSEAAHRWREREDQIAEVAFDVVTAADAARRCADCGLDPEDYWDSERGRPQTFGLVKIARRVCPACSDIQAMTAELTEDERKAGVTYRFEPREREEPWKDRGSRPEARTDEPASEGRRRSRPGSR